MLVIGALALETGQNAISEAYSVCEICVLSAIRKKDVVVTKLVPEKFDLHALWCEIYLKQTKNSLQARQTMLQYHLRCL